jgi:hypothetical protein
VIEVVGVGIMVIKIALLFVKLAILVQISLNKLHSALDDILFPVESTSFSRHSRYQKVEPLSKMCLVCKDGFAGSNFIMPSSVIHILVTSNTLNEN